MEDMGWLILFQDVRYPLTIAQIASGEFQVGQFRNR
jgi:hypothetical protein